MKNLFVISALILISGESLFLLSAKAGSLECPKISGTFGANSGGRGGVRKFETTGSGTGATFQVIGEDNYGNSPVKMNASWGLLSSYNGESIFRRGYCSEGSAVIEIKRSGNGNSSTTDRHSFSLQSDGKLVEKIKIEHRGGKTQTVVRKLVPVGNVRAASRSDSEDEDSDDDDSRDNSSAQ